MNKRIGLVLTGGGARAGYQAGVLKGIAEIIGPTSGDSWPFHTLVGTSAGAINSAFLASKSGGSFAEATTALDRLWSALTAEKVVRSDVLTLTALGLRWLRDLSLGGLLGNSRSTHLLDASPLREFLNQQIDFAAIRANLQHSALHGLAISATNYLTGTTVIFFDGAASIKPWIRSSRVGIRTRITLNHVLASAAIPVFFQPVKLNGAYYGDGCVRLTTPLSPAMHLGAERVLAIGIRHQRPDNLTLKLTQNAEMPTISLVDIAGVMLNAAFLDALDTDIERIPRTLSLGNPQRQSWMPLDRLGLDAAISQAEECPRIPRRDETSCSLRKRIHGGYGQTLEKTATFAFKEVAIGAKFAL